MAAKWSNITLGEFVALQRGHDLTEPERRTGRVPVVGSAGHNGFHDTALAKAPGIVIGRSGASFGQVHFSKEDFWPHNTGLYVTDFKGNDPLFAFYFLKALDFDRYNSGSAQPSLNRNFIYPIPIRVPKPSEQKRIAEVLGALDDKIELNQRMNGTLEETARAIFKSWFVDFDPVRAKLDGRLPLGMDSATSAFFPDSFEESQLGHIPNGWKVKPVGDVIDCVGGGTPSTSEPKYWEGGTNHWTTPKDFSSLQAPILLDTERRVTDAGVDKISSGLLPAGTLLMSSRAPVGYLAISAIPVAINQGFIAMKCNDRASNYFMLNWCQQNMAEIEGRATGTTFAEISKQNFRPIPLVLPTQDIMAAFSQRVAPLYSQITANLHQSRTLATLRDALLPKLLSGDMSINEEGTNSVENIQCL
jgi:type I restriction enzyme S subunit